MSVGSLQNAVDALTCRRQSFRQVWYKSAVNCMRNANISKNHLVHNGQENENVIQNPHTDPDQHEQLSLLEGHSLPTPAKFDRRPFLRSSVSLSILFTE